MINALLLLVPQEAWLCLIVLGGLLMILGFRKAAMSLIGGVILMALLSPFIEPLLDLLPTWILVLLLIFVFMSVLRLFLGERVADHIIARLLYDIIVLPFRFIRWVFTGSRRGM